MIHFMWRRAPARYFMPKPSSSPGASAPFNRRVPGAEDFAGKTLHYRVQDPKQFAGKKLAILGGGDSALDWVLELIDVAGRITLVHRRDEYRAVPASVDKMRKLAADGKKQISILYYHMMHLSKYFLKKPSGQLEL